MTTSPSKELYQPGQAVLYRLDPRLKVLSCLILVPLVFAADSLQLVGLGVILSIAVWMASPALASVWRTCWMLRWLLLFTLLIHLLFSPGRTLWGSSWLSLDGLQVGFMVCVQMLLAITVSILLARTTSLADLVRSFGWCVRPLQQLGFRTDEWQKILFLTMDFIPLVKTEIDLVRGSNAEGFSAKRPGRWSQWGETLNCFLVRLIDKGDTIAQRMASDDEFLGFSSRLPPLFPLAVADRLFSLMVALVIVCFCLAG